MSAPSPRGPLITWFIQCGAAVLRSVVVAVLVLGATVAALLSVDRINRPERAVDPGIAAVDTTLRHRRLLMLHVDSWRDSSARDSTLFPQTARLRREGASGTLQGVYEGFTIPAVRAAFTGVAETQLVNLIQNFHFTALPLSSVFRDAHALGRRTLAVAREPFVQFGPVLEIRYDSTPGQSMYETDKTRPHTALEAYRQGFDIVICQWETFDWVAHEEGVSSARYRAAALQSDSVIAAFAAARAPEDYLLVYGDHGHTWSGEHKTGYDIPGFVLLLGPDVNAGADLGELPITNLRYLASHALGITLRGAPYDLATLRRAIPIRGDANLASAAATTSSEATPTAEEPAAPEQNAPTSTTEMSGAGAGLSKRPSDYLMALVILAVVTAVAMLSLRLLSGPAYTAQGLVPALVLFAAAMLLSPLVPPVDAWLRPAGLPAVVFLYAVAVVAKLALFLRRVEGRWLAAVVATAAVAAVEFWNAVFDQPLLLMSLLMLATVGAFAPRERAYRDLARLALLQMLVYATLRLPLYLFAWLDLVLLATYALARHPRLASQAAMRDALIVLAAYSCTIGWVPGGLEWGFLYTMFPAHLVELEVQRFLPLILAKLPLVLLLFLTVTRRAPDRALAQVVMLMLGIRLAAVWMLGLAGAPTVELWPLAEHGAYLSTFVVAVVAWGWHARRRDEINPLVPHRTAIGAQP